MLYILDANALIDASRDYYSFDVVPEFWEWLVHMGNNNLIKIPVEIYEELKEGNDDLSNWTKDPDVERALLLQEEADPQAVSDIINNGYAPDLNDVEIEKVGRDPFLISYALTDPDNRVVVTTERSRPSAERGNRKVPDVCRNLGISTRNTYQLVKDLGFSTSWAKN